MTKILIAISLAVALQNSNAQQAEVNAKEYSTKVIASDLSLPWAHEFLPNGDILITERGGRIKVVRGDQLLSDDVANVPTVYFAGQGGLLDIMKDADFANKRCCQIKHS